ncbi:MAG: hypothetical protein VCD00_19105 [Candidatus Hydrogenedentota bacterium]
MTDPALPNKIKEELRVGGVIAGTCGLMGCIALVWLNLSGVDLYLQRDPQQLLWYVCAAPVIIAALLILNIDYTGAMQAGFSARILQLPVSTFIPVTIAFVLRTSFVSLASIGIIALSRTLFEYQIGYKAALFIVTFYLALQVLDWTRNQFKGISSVVASIALGYLAWYLLGDGSWEIPQFFGDLTVHVDKHPNEYLIALIILGILSFGVSLFAVRAARAGRQYGIPEIWEWHKQFDLSSKRTRNRNPFRSPIAAQAWWETRRSIFLLPIVATGWPFALFIGIWYVSQKYPASREGYVDMPGYAVWGAFVPFAGVLTGAIAHGLVKGILWYRSPKGLPGFHHLQPLTTEQMANARMLSNAMLLLPLLIIANIIHFAWPQSGFITEYIPEALNIGVTSIREVIWVLIGRALLIGLIAWALMAVLTRVTGLLLILSLILSIATLLLSLLSQGNDTSDILLVSATISIVICLATAIRCIHLGLLSSRTIAFWLFLWALTAWLIHGQAAISMAGVAPAPKWYLAGLWTCIAVASLVPLPFLATTLDLHRRRHGTTTKLHQPTTALSPMPRQVAALMAIALFTLWLGWPARPAYEATYRAKDMPTNLDDLNEHYAEVPEEENLASAFLRLIQLQQQKEQEHIAYFDSQFPDPKTPGEQDDRPQYWENLLFMGHEYYEPGDIIPDEVLSSTHDYWQGVTSFIAPEIRALSEQENPRSRYPIDFRNGMSMEMEHLAQLRHLAREMRLDAWYWASQGNSEKALASLYSIHTIADSLYQEPVLISAMVGKAISGIARGSAQYLLNDLQLSDSQLSHLQAELQAQEDQYDEARNNAVIGERIIMMSSPDLISYSFNSEKWRAHYTPVIPLSSLMMPIAAERIVTGVEVQRALERPKMSAREAINYHEESGERLWTLWFMAPMSVLRAPGYLNVNHGAAQMYSDITQTGIAVERYCVVNDRLPDSLNQLIPTFLEEVPQDHYGEAGATLRYRKLDNGGYVVYSVGRDGIDQRGFRSTEDKRIDDITFTVAR